MDNCDTDMLAANWLLSGGRTEKHYYYHYDGLGSVIAISDQAGNTIEKYEYSVYGEVNIVAKQNGETRSASIVGNPYYFTGRRLDTETGLYYYRARYYSPPLGRFLQTDPSGYEDGINWYTYVQNNPVVFRDPFGLCVDDGAANPVYSWSRRRRGTIDSTGRTYSEQETNAILGSIRNPLTYMWHGGPAGHAIPPGWGGYDFKVSNDEFTLRIDGRLQVLSGSEFGNVLAGHAGTYYGRDVGLGLTFMAGDYFARTEGLSEDDYESRRDIIRGYDLAIEQKRIEEEHFRQALSRLRSDFSWMGP